ncbi:hypothetical protein G647_02832 [Cladophialophora carrionii CBS 160.54]|uniref:Uncharacterized protein n=1 Tax=Cladophialophora carrionii CBS 160.54 TaxID=1279043 RepID=V9DGS5_9EURO|nr:uncharacterized protein G647_02832 [Cladophialophora carrionii CBS 160.54]ETI26055.1 hypothetical protein G647_02832 [Cladophialophora carrionii CBS 160.54]
MASSSKCNYSISDTASSRTNKTTKVKSSTSADPGTMMSISSRNQKADNGVIGLARAFGSFRPFLGGKEAGRSQQSHESRETRQCWDDTWGSIGSEGSNSHGNNNGNSQIANNGQLNNLDSKDRKDKVGQLQNKESCDEEEVSEDWLWRQADEAAAGASWWKRK